MINFNNTYYCCSFLENEKFSSEADLIDHLSMKGLQFQYGNVTHKKFNGLYDKLNLWHTVPGNWRERKINAIPRCLVSGVVKTICHLALAIFVGVPLAVFKNGRYLKVLLFHLARDLQESYGWLATLFHDQYGQFHVEESAFHKECYLNILSDTKAKELSKRECYEALGLTANASAKEIKDRFHKLALANHPDKTQKLSQSERAARTEKFTKDAEAYAILTK